MNHQFTKEENKRGREKEETIKQSEAINKMTLVRLCQSLKKVNGLNYLI